MAREHLLVVGWGGGVGGRGLEWGKAPGHPNLFSKNYIYNTPETHTTNRTRYLSALNYESLVQPTRMEGKNSYCVVKCVIKCVINEQCNRWSLSFCRAI